MKLVPADPPGRSSRKARRFAQDMRELRDQGYTFEAIRMALAAVGVHVSNATVQREVARAVKGLGAAGEVRPMASPAPTPVALGIRTEADRASQHGGIGGVQAGEVHQKIRRGRGWCACRMPCAR